MAVGTAKNAGAGIPSAADLGSLSREEKLALLRRLAAGEGAVGGSGGPTGSKMPGRFPASFEQRRLWFLDRLEPGGSHNTIFRALRLRGALDRQAMIGAITRLGERHDAFRTRFAEEDGEPFQVVEAPGGDGGGALPGLVQVIDLSCLGGDERQARLDALARAEAERPFDLSRAPLARFTLVLLGPEEAALLVALHHIVADGWSLGIVLRELSALYRPDSSSREAKDDGEAEGVGGEPRLSALTTRYGEHARSQRERLGGEALERELDFWRGALDGAPTVLDLPTDRPRPALETFQGAIEPVRLDGSATEAVKGLAREERATPFMVLLAAFAAVLARWSGRDDLLLGTPVAGRPRQDLEPLVGLFANTLVLRADLSGAPSFRALLRRVRSGSLAAFGHQEMPFERLVEDLVPERDLSRNPLFQVMFALQTMPAATVELAGLTVEPLPVLRRLSKVDLTLDLVERRGTLAGYLEYNTDLFDATTVRRLARAVERAVALLAASPDIGVSRLDVLGRAERHALLVEWQGDGAGTESARAPEALPVHEAFARALIRNGERTALEVDGRSWSYGALRSAAGRVEEALAAAGVGVEDRVGVLAERSPEAIAAFLGVLGRGAAYVPLDPEYPDERLSFMAADAGVRALLAGEGFGERAERLAPAGAPVIALERQDLFAAEPGAADSTEPSAGWAGTPPERAAYVIYTSGTTGRPKGVVIPHRALANHAAAIAESYELRETDRVLQFASISFDIAGEEIYPTLARGATLVLRTPAVPLEPRGFARYADEKGLTVVNLPTPLWHEWCLELDRATGAAAEELLPPAALRLVVVGTEGALPERLAAWRRALRRAGRSELRWVNAYGPTEATITSVLHGASPGRAEEEGSRWIERGDQGGRVPIGRPITGLTAQVLDAHLDPVPLGAAGELCLGGAGLARGYLGRPGATAAAFVPDPASGLRGEPGARLYRTGDLARVRPDGAIEFLGRVDDQVKIRGFRIEPGEVEAALAAHPAVREVAVLAVEAGASDGAGSGTGVGDRRLAAYVVASEGDAAAAGCTEEALGAWLGERLPAYMVPAAFVLVDELPLTPAGKVDRRALPVPTWGGTRGSSDGSAHEPLRGPVEELLAGLWAEVLGIEGEPESGPGVGARDDFFRLGGHSLLATRVVARIRDRLGVEIPVRTLFEAPTVRGLARRVVEARADARGAAGGASALPPLVRADRSRPLPASFAQQRLWFLDRLEPGSAQYLMPGRVALDVPGHVLQRALREIVRRHESLRTVLAPPPRTAGDGTDGLAAAPVQVVLPVREEGADGAGSMAVVDLSDLPAPAIRVETERVARAEGRRPMDLEAGPLVRFLLLRLDGGNEPGQLLFTVHHAVSDGWSTDLFLGELAVLCAAFAEGRPSPLAELPVQYGDYAAWQRTWLAGELLERETAHWRAALDGMPGLLELPADRPRPPVPSGRGGKVRFALPAGAVAAVSALCRSGAAATPFMVLLAAFAAVLHRHSGQGDFAVGTPIAGRDRTELEGLIGFFANTLVLRTRLGDDPPFAALLERVRETALDAYGHQELPFEKLVEELRPERNLSHHPLFQVLFAYQDTAGAAPSGDTSGAAVPTGGGLRLLPSDNGTSRFDLVLNLWPTRSAASGARGMAGAIEYAGDLFDPTTVARLAGHLGVLLETAGRRPEARVSELPLLGAAERQAVLAEWNDTDSPVPELGAGLGLHDLVAAQARRTPEAVALAAGREAVSYGELDRRVDALAETLRGLGVGPETVVGVCAERSTELVVGLHAVVRAGGAYLPLDPAYPADRLAFMLEDAAVPVLLTQKRLLDGEPDESLGTTLRASGARIVLLDRRAERPEPDRKEPAGGVPDVAYVIYTSGSTGRPKGVMVPHRGIVNRLVWMQRAYGLTACDTVLQKTPFSFDVSVWELFWPLMTGARLELAEPGRHGDPGYLAALLDERRITTLHFVPSMLQAFLEGGAKGDGTASGRSVRRVITSGEALPPSLAERLFERLPWARLHNLYGPTEASVDVSYHPCRAGEARVPIGRPIENLRLHVLDRHGRPAPVGVPGELHLSGSGSGSGAGSGMDTGLARGYLGRPSLTAERFVPDPFTEASRPGARLYRTGDLCRWLPDGEVEFLGRIDFQVKVRGLRIELGEIEAALAAHPAVREVVVTALALTPSGGAGSADARLVAYLVPDGERTEDLSVPALRAWVGRTLPDYMVPSAFVVLDALPLSPNGKVDRRALPEPGDDRPDLRHGFVAPRTQVEEDLVSVWREVLRLDRIGVEDNFFELGGHSLLATQVVTRVEERFGVELPLRAVFEAPTVAGLAERIVDLGLDGVAEDDLSRLLDGIDDLSEDELAALLADEAGDETDGRA